VVEYKCSRNCSGQSTQGHKDQQGMGYARKYFNQKLLISRSNSTGFHKRLTWLGPGGRRFKSSLPDHIFQQTIMNRDCSRKSHPRWYNVICAENGDRPFTGSPIPHSGSLRRSSRSRSHVKMTESRSKRGGRELTIPPEPGGQRPHELAPVRVDHISGKRPATTVATVITWAKRKSAPSITAGADAR